MLNSLFEKHFLKKPLLFWIILVFGLLTRICFLESLPMGVNQDEAMGAVDAWALLKYGTDRYGMQWPVHFTAWEGCQMSVLLAYLMIPFMKVFGFTVYAIRLPMALISTLSIVVIYFVAKRFLSEKAALGVMAFSVICPWHFMQGRWSLDCNMFPHVFLIGFLFLLKGLERHRYIYLSMIFFGLTFYCYGIAIYTVPVFLLVFAIWGMLKKQFTLREILIAVAIFLLVVAPEVITMIINIFNLDTVEFLWFTMPKFPYGVRSGENIFAPSDNTKQQLVANILCTLKYGLFQQSDAIFNVIPKFGTMYYISIPFYVIGTVLTIKNVIVSKGKDLNEVALLGFFMSGIWVGIVTNNVNVNRINIIFYPLILLTCRGICWLIDRFKNTKIVTRIMMGAYTVCWVSFIWVYVTDFADEIKIWFSADYLAIIQEADAMDGYDVLYITDRAGTQQWVPMVEILTQYALQIDSKYYQEETNITGGRELLSYSERYHWKNVGLMDWESDDILYVLHKKDLKDVPVGYEVLGENESYVIAAREVQ